MDGLSKILYYPGCTLSQKAKNFNETALSGFKMLGIELVELKNWYCCQADFSLVSDNLMAMLAASRNLVLAGKEGKEIAVSCSTCYNVLKRTNHMIKNDEAKRKTITDFLEEGYDGSVRVIHLLELLKERGGFQNILKAVKRNLSGVKIAPYYGCLLLRPHDEMQFDNPEDPGIFSEFIKSLGAVPVDYPYRSECCGSYLTVSSPDVIADCVSKIISGAIERGASFIITSCPLCQFNLDWGQTIIKKKNNNFRTLPVFYFTEILAYALELISVFDKERHFIDPVIN